MIKIKTFKIFENGDSPLLIEVKRFYDIRGFFQELYRESKFKEHIPYRFVQVNFSFSRKGVIRGLHYQLKPYEQGKLVTVLSGRIYDVAVDIRRGSPYFGKYVATELSADRPILFWIPPGFAHGFQALEENTTILYLVTKEYAPEFERTILYNDPEIGIDWPIKENIIVSEKDKKGVPLRCAETNFEYKENA